MLMPEVAAAYPMPVLSKASDGPLPQSLPDSRSINAAPAEGFLAWERVPHLCEGLSPEGPRHSMDPHGKSFAKQTDHVPTEQTTHMWATEEFRLLFSRSPFRLPVQTGRERPPRPPRVRSSIE